MANRNSSVLLTLLTLTALSLATTACSDNGSHKAGASTTAATTSATGTSRATTGTSTVKSSTSTTKGSTTTTGPTTAHPQSGSVTVGPTPVKTPGTGTAPVASSSGSTTAPTTSSSTAPSAPLVGPNASAFLYVASSNDKITTLALDPITGAPSNAVDTDMGTGGSFVPSAIAADTSGSTLLVTGSTSLMAIGLNVGVLTLPAAGSTTDPVVTTFPSATGVAVLPGTSIALTADSNAYSGAGGVDAFSWQSATNGIVLEASGNLGGIGSYGGPTSLAIDPTGAWVYLANGNDGNVQTAAVTTSTTTVTFGTPTTPAADPNWATNYVVPTCCVLVTQSGGTAFFTGNSDGTISAFPVTAPGTFGTVSTAYTPSAASLAGNGDLVTGIAVDSTGAFLVISDSSANQLFAFNVTISGTTGTITLAPAGAGAGPVAAASSVCFNADGPVCYATDNEYVAGNVVASSVHAYSVSSTGLSPIGSGPVALPDVNDAPIALTVSK